MERLRQVLLKFLQDKHVKVSLFIQEGMQNFNGTLIFPKEIRLGVGIQLPGKY